MSKTHIKKYGLSGFIRYICSGKKHNSFVADGCVMYNRQRIINRDIGWTTEAEFLDVMKNMVMNYEFCRECFIRKALLKTRRKRDKQDIVA